MKNSKKLTIPANRVWTEFHKSPQLASSKTFPLTKDMRVFTMGSCFAMEIRKALAKKGFVIYPDYLSVDFDQNTQVFDRVPERPFIAHYDTFVIRQEIETALGEFRDRDSSFWLVKEAGVNERTGIPDLYQDPLRKVVYSTTHDGLRRLASNIDTAIRLGVEQSDVYVITLGLTEVWQHNKTGRYLCQSPYSGGGGNSGMATFRQSTFEENYANIRAILEMLFSRYPNKRVVLTVSPVPLSASYSATDIFTANLESKSILRAVAGQICREYDNAFYFPAYEIANLLPTRKVFESDGRHVLPQFAERVVALFEASYSEATIQ